ncbi:hypothetical protein [Streptomyces sp. NPDC059009]|uniref:hypothetical protein n=1 Tax=Streptomyces sp. NPDC059009 TaxID=3346694 RepID=UPI00368BAEB1
MLATLASTHSGTTSVRSTNLRVAVNSSYSGKSDLSHGLVLELTVHSQDFGQLCETAYRWLTQGAQVASVQQELDQLTHDRPVSKVGFDSVSDVASRREAGDLWGYLSVAPVESLNVLYNPFTSRALEWLRESLTKRPESAGMDVGRYSDSGEISDSLIRLAVTFDEDLPEYVMLSYFVDEVKLVDSSTAAIEHERLLGVMEWACREFNVVFGHTSYDRPDRSTEHERFLRGPAPWRNTPNWASMLRGYSWLTVASADVVRALGGSGSLRNSGAFVEVAELPCGSYFLQATPTYAEYHDERVLSVYQALQPALVEGEFRRPSAAPGQPPTHMIIFDEDR